MKNCKWLVLVAGGLGVQFLLLPPLNAANPLKTAASDAGTPKVRESFELGSPGSAEAMGSVTLAQALAMAIDHNPELAALGKERAATEGAVEQAGVLPNPAVGIIVDSFGNSRVREQGDLTTGLQLDQLIELGGKRTARVRLAETNRDLAGWDHETKRADLRLRVSTAFLDVLTGQRRQTLAEESVRLARLVVEAVSKRVQAGKVSPVEETRARLTLSSTQIELEQARRELLAARGRLGAFWNDPAPRFERVIGELDSRPALPPYEQLLRGMPSNPDVARWSSEIARREADVDVEKAKAVPDLTLIGGVKRFSQFNDTAYVLGVSIPLPLFDRNRGGILEATRRVGRTLDEKRAAQTRVASELVQAYQRAAAADSEIQTLRVDILPGAQSAFDAATKGYQLGKFGFLDVLDAERTLFQARAQHLRATAEYARTTYEIERLIGGPLDGAALDTRPQPSGSSK